MPETPVALRMPRDPQTLGCVASLRYIISDEVHERTDIKDFRWLQPHKAQRLINLIGESSMACYERHNNAPLDLSVTVKRIIGDPSGRWLPFSEDGIVKPGYVKGWLAISKENIDGGMLEFRDGTHIIRKELSPGLFMTATSGIEWRMRPVFSWDNASEGVFDIIEWQAEKMNACDVSGPHEHIVPFIVMSN